MKRMFKYKVEEDLDLGKDPETKKPLVYSAGDVIEVDKMHLHTKAFKLAIKAGKLVPSDEELVQSELAPEMMKEPEGEVMEKPEGEEVVEEPEAPVEEPEAPVEEEPAPEDEEQPEEPVPDLRNGIS